MGINILKYLKRANMFPDTISVRQRTGGSTYKGASTYGTAVVRNAFVVGQIKMVKDSNGKNVVSTVYAVFDGHYDLTALDEYTLPSHFSPNVLEPIVVQEASDENGAHHQTVFF